MADADVIRYIKWALQNITCFGQGPQQGTEIWRSRFGMNQTWHWFKHCFGPLGDTHGVLTEEAYLRLGQQLGRMAANGALGTYYHYRAGDILVYWQRRSVRGIFMSVRPYQYGSELITLFSPNEGKAYFDRECNKPGRRLLS